MRINPSNFFLSGVQSRLTSYRQQLAKLKQQPSGRIIALCVMVVFCLAGLSSLVMRRAQAAGNVTGTVFQDFNGNSVKDTNDPGLGGITVTAYNAAGTAVATATSSTTAATLGQYTLNLSAVANGTALRIEFTGAASYLESGPQGAAAGSSGSSVQFVTTSAGGLTNLNYGVNNPGNYCQANPRLATSSYAHGDQAGQTRTAVVTTSYTASGTSTANYTSESQAQQTGSTWGLAYHRTSNTLFSSAFIKRNAGLAPNAQHPGSDGTGAIYRTTVGGSVDGTLFVDLDVLFSNAALTGANPHTDFDPNPPDYDSGAYGAVGKIALGGLAISEDDQTLYVINLVDRRMYKLPIGLTPTAPAAGAVTSYLVPNPGCTNGVGRPFAVKTHNGLVYAGGVCTGESGGSAANLSAYVYSFNPVSSTWSASPVLSFPLNYTRGCADISGGYNTSGCRPSTTGSFADWRPWRDTLDTTFANGYSGGYVAYPQAMLTNIEFLQNSNSGGEDMVIALRDRFGDQIGNNDPGPTGDEPTAFPANGSALNSTPAGEILRASLNASNVWVIEQNSHNAPSTAVFGPAGGANNNQGPVSASGADSGQSGEFYLDNHPTNHDEIACGGLAHVPGNAELAATVVDPVNLFSGGTTQFLNTNGARSRSYEINLGSGGFAKADSFSDLEAICNVAPVELGNRVWNDVNGNGIQDAGEAPLSGIAVRLLDATGTTTIATATTDANGNYLFSSASGTSTTSVIYGLSALDAGTTYQLRVDTTQVGLIGMTTTRQNGDASANGDSRDSDAAQSGIQSIITLTTGGPGANNHTYDFGFAATFSLGNRVWFDTNNNGQMETSGTAEVGVDGVVVELVDLFGTALQSQSTSGGGYYRFDNVIPGVYTVRIAASNFTGAGVLVGYQNSTGATVGIDRRDNGVDVGNPSTAGISSAAITVSVSMPASEPDVTGSGIGAHGPRGDVTDNLLIDFGFYRITLGNLCFNDSNNNGLFGGADVGLVNCTLRIYQSDGTTEVPVGPDGILGTTDDITGATNRLITVAGGAYTFSGLTPGAYVVKATPTAGFRSANFTAGTSNPDGNVDNDDNGLGTATGQASSAPITLSAGGEPTVTNATATTTNNTLDFGFTTAAPTAVKLSSFNVKTDGNDTLITWRSGFEVSNLGYLLYREDANGGRVQITPSLVAGSALVVGLQTRMEAGLGFAWWDRSGNQSLGTRYWLEAVDLDGSREMFGPFDVERGSLPLARPQPAKLLNELGSSDEFRIEREFPASSVQSNARNPRGTRGASPMVDAMSSSATGTQFELAADPHAVKLLVTQNGWFRVNRADLVAAGIPAGAVNSNLQLFRNGVEVPIVVSDVDGSVQFYGQKLDTLESGTNVYWLRAGSFAGQRIPFQAQDSVPGPSAQNFRMTVERRDRIVYFSSLLNGDGNNFFGPVLGVNPVSQAVNVRYVDQTAGGTATLEVSAVGLTLQAHQLQVKLNGTVVGVISYSNREQPVWSTSVDIGLVWEGENVVTLQSVGAGSDVSLTEHVSLTYPRVYRAEQGTADVSIAAGQTLRIDGLRNGPVQVWDITDPNQPRGMQVTPVNSNGRFTLYLPPTGVERHLLALASNATPLAPAGIRSNEPSQLNADDLSGRQMVVIAPRELQAGLTPLLELRQSQGINSVVVDIEDVFDEFGYGLHASSAIKAYLSHIGAGNSGRPGYVLLVGDSSFDPRNYLHQGENDLVPTRLVDTEFMETASDDWFVDFNNDSLPDAAIGRFPVRTPQELATVVSKVLTYETMPVESQRHAVMVSDTEFVAASQMVTGSLPAGTMVTAVERGSDTDAMLRQRLLDGLNNGPSIVNFTGHGQMSVWTGGGLFTVDDPATLTNERPSVYIMLSCLNNFWHDANHESIGEALLKSPHAAAAVWGSSGTTYSDPQVVMALDLYGRYSSAPGVRIGDAIRQAKVATYSLDVRRTWVLFGDPTMRLR